MSRLSDDKFEPNLTPILDMVFQLITFFMLVINFKTASVDVNLKLPVLGSAAPIENTGEEYLLLNLDAKGQLRVYGKEENLARYVAQEANVARRLAAQDADKTAKEGELPITVVVRADRDLPFHLLNSAIRTCQAQGFRKFYYRAMTKEQDT